MRALTFALIAGLLAGCQASVTESPSSLIGVLVLDIEVDSDTVGDDAAEVFVGGDFVGNGELRLPLREGLHELRVEIEGFEPYVRRVRVLGRAEYQNVYVQLRPLPGGSR